jgi:hypothetical protein
MKNFTGLSENLKLMRGVKVSLLIALVAVIGFGLAACKNETDDFAGVWINTEEVAKITAADGSWTMYMDNVQFMRGSYTVSGNTVDMKTNDLYNEDEKKWVSISALPVEILVGVPQTLRGTISGNKFTVQETIFTKQ